MRAATSHSIHAVSMATSFSHWEAKSGPTNLMNAFWSNVLTRGSIVPKGSNWIQMRTLNGKNSNREMTSGSGIKEFAVKRNLESSS